LISPHPDCIGFYGNKDDDDDDEDDVDHWEGG
jgi:hypothetical protein